MLLEDAGSKSVFREVTIGLIAGVNLEAEIYLSVTAFRYPNLRLFGGEMVILEVLVGTFGV